MGVFNQHYHSQTHSRFSPPITLSRYSLAFHHMFPISQLSSLFYSVILAVAVFGACQELSLSKYLGGRQLAHVVDSVARCVGCDITDCYPRDLRLDAVGWPQRVLHPG